MTDSPTTPATCPKCNAGVHPNYGHSVWTCGSHMSLAAQNPEFIQSSACLIEQQRQEIAAKDLQIGDLAMLIRRLLYATRPDGSVSREGLMKMREQVQDYLNRNGLQGSILREESP